MASRRLALTLTLLLALGLGLYGAARAAELSGDRTKALTYYSQLVTLGEKADTERHELRQAKAFLDR
jgi:hypothetical protein